VLQPAGRDELERTAAAALHWSDIMLRTLEDSETRARVLARVATLRPDSPRRWGRMDAHGMVCHLNDMFRHALGDRPGPPVVGGPLHRTVVKWWALGVPIRWPHGFPTARQFDQEREGTRPAAFEADRDDLVALIHRVADPAATLGAHPLFGPLTRAEWGRWGFRHTDHHLRQFGA
jgi:hypothetical protein